MVNFEKIRYKNFLSTGNIFTEINLNTGKIVAIIGKNGHGKSTLLDAITYSLFGKPYRDINIPQLLNTITKKNLVVEIEFSIGSNRYKIVRGMKPSIFEIYENYSLLNQQAKKDDYQKVLENQILKRNYKTFCQVDILGSAAYESFMKLKGPDRRKVIDDILGVEILTTMNLILKNKIAENKEKIVEVQNNIKILESKIQLENEHIKKIEQNNEKVVEEKKQLIKTTEDDILDLTDKLNFISDSIEAMKSENSDSDKITTKINKLNNLKDQLTSKINLLNKDKVFYENNDNCPTCKQSINQEFKNLTFIEIDSKISESNSGLEQLAIEYEKTKNRLDQILKIDEKVRNSQIERIQIQTSIDSLIKYKTQLENELNSLYVDNYESNIEQYKKQLTEFQDEYNSLNEQRELNAISANLLKDTGIKSKIIKQYIPKINENINKYLDIMDFFVSFELDENFNETIKSRYRDTFSYNSFSEGQKKKIDLALLFTWREIAKMRNSVNTNLLIFDEVFDSSLDSEAIEYLRKVLIHLSKSTNIFVISHNEQIGNMISETIKFVMVKNFSKIEE